MKTKKYQKEDLTIVWKPELCIHAEKCWHGLGEVFKPSEKPWIQPEGADKNAIIEQIKNCPSGALSFLIENQPTNMEDTKTKISIIPNGPVMVQATCEITLANGEKVSKENRVALCRCGLSNNKPFCDGTHKGKFEADS